MSDNRWVTTTQLLETLHQSNDAPAWDQFCGHFYPVVVRFAVRLGLSATDAEEAAQDTMLEFVKAFRAGKYVRGKGRLSNWLLGIAKNRILNLRRGKPLEHLVADKTTGTSFWDLVQDDHDIQKTWEKEWRQMVLEKCLGQVQQEFHPRVFSAFEQCGLNGVPVAQVCQELNMSRNAVYLAKFKVTKRLRELTRQFDE